MRVFAIDLRLPILALFSLITLTGCASRGARVTFETSQHRYLTQVFNQAYITDSGSGEYDIVLVDSPANYPQRNEKIAPSSPCPSPPFHRSCTSTSTGTP